MSKSFHGGVRPGQRVTYMAPNGIGRNGVEYKEKTGKVVFVNQDSLVLNAGGRHGTPAVVTAKNFIRAA